MSPGRVLWRPMSVRRHPLSVPDTVNHKITRSRYEAFTSSDEFGGLLLVAARNKKDRSPTLQSVQIATTGGRS